MVDNVSCKLFGPSIQNEDNSVHCNSEYAHENDDCNIPESSMDSSGCIPSTSMDCHSSCILSEGSQCISSISTGCHIHHSVSKLTGHDGYHYICTCCHRPNIKRNVVYFNISKYDITNEIVQKALSNQFTDRKMREVICKPCHKSLHSECPAMPACVSLLQHGLDIQCSSVRHMCACISCGGNTPYLQTIPFDVSHYNNDAYVIRNVLHDANPDDRICKKCNTKFVRHCL